MLILNFRSEILIRLARDLKIKILVRNLKIKLNLRFDFNKKYGGSPVTLKYINTGIHNYVFFFMRPPLPKARSRGGSQFLLKCFSLRRNRIS